MADSFDELIDSELTTKPKRNDGPRMPAAASTGSAPRAKSSGIAWAAPPSELTDAVALLCGMLAGFGWLNLVAGLIVAATLLSTGLLNATMVAVAAMGGALMWFALARIIGLLATACNQLQQLISDQRTAANSRNDHLQR